MWDICFLWCEEQEYGICLNYAQLPPIKNNQKKNNTNL